MEGLDAGRHRLPALHIHDIRILLENNRKNGASDPSTTRYCSLLHVVNVPLDLREGSRCARAVAGDLIPSGEVQLFY